MTNYQYKVGDRVRSKDKGRFHKQRSGVVSGFDHARGQIYVDWEEYSYDNRNPNPIKDLEPIITIEGFEI